MLYLITLLPPLFFLIILLWLDSFSLVKKKILLLAFGWGIVAALASVPGNRLFGEICPIPLIVAPIVEEFMKGLGILFIIKMRRSAFFIDAAIYGAAIGAGFSFLENIFYVRAIPDMLVGTAIVRGFGTAIMHCGCVISTAVILSWLANNRKGFVFYYPLALIPAILLHSFYNSLVMPPILSLVVILVGVCVWTIILFLYNEKSISGWIETELSSEVEMLSAFSEGTFSKSGAGQYMLSLKEQFAPECFFDMFCYVQLYYELSLASKTNMMLAEAGLPIVKNEETTSKVKEFYQLRKQIGKTAQIALFPLIKQNQLATWKIDSMSN